MNESFKQALPLALSILAGGMLGTMFFGGLWWTIRKSMVSAQPALWIFASLFVRMGVALTGFYFVAGMYWQRWLACLLGFFVARVIVARITRGHEISSAKLVERHSSCT
jgi:F1F0 ATPase subunit 2